MKVVDKISGMMRNLERGEIEDDEDYGEYDEYDEDAEDDEYDEVEGKFPKKRRGLFKRKEKDFDTEEGEDDVKHDHMSKVTSIDTHRTQKNHPKWEVKIVRPKEYADLEAITEALRSGKVVILNLVGLNDGWDKRVFDYSAGVGAAFSAGIVCITDGIFIISPPTVVVDTGNGDCIKREYDMKNFKYDEDY